MFTGKDPSKHHLPGLGWLNSIFVGIFFGYDKIAKDKAAGDAQGPYGAQQGIVRLLATREEVAKHIGEKAGQAGFDTVIRILGTAKTKIKAEGITNDVALALNLFRDNYMNWFQTRRIILIDWITYQYNRHQIPLIRQFCKENGVMLSFRQGNPRGGLEQKEIPLPTETLKMSCDWLWKAMQINFNGDVLQCCEGVIWSQIKPYTTYKAGTFKVKDIWNGKQAVATRELMTTQGRTSMPICKQCQRQGVCFKW